jgi:hypothetical protein
MILIFCTHPTSYILPDVTILVTFDEDYDVQSTFTILNIHTQLSLNWIPLSRFPDPKIYYCYFAIWTMHSHMMNKIPTNA